MPTHARPRLTAGALLVALGLALAGCSAGGRATPTSGAAGASTEGAVPPSVPGDPTTEALTLPLDELYQRALAEGGTLVCYCSLAQVNAERIYPLFEQRFPGIKVEQIDLTIDKLVARLVSEARGGKVLGDVLSGSVESMLQAERQRLLVEGVSPEAEAMPEALRTRTFVASDLQFIVPSWNTTLVRPDEAPTQLEDFAEPRWKGRLAAEPRDAEFLIALTHKLGSEERAVDVLRQIAANDVEFYKGHSDLAEMVVAGQAAVCITCYSHHYPPRIKRGAPVDYMLTEGIGTWVGTGALKGAPHPYTAMLWQRWAPSEAGQQAYAEGGRAPALPSVQPKEKVRPERYYAVTADDLTSFSRYERVWKDVFQIR